MSKKKFDSPEFYNKKLYETENFAVIPDKCPIVEGWLLIIPKKQILSYGYLQQTALYNELEALLDYVGKVVRKLYGDFVVFEHGAYSQNKSVGCGVDYAHIHIVPTEHNLVNELEVKYDWRQIVSLKETANYIQNNQPYLYYRNQQNESFITTNESIPSQLFRKAVASAMGMSDKYDWNTNSFPENLQKTIDTYKDVFNLKKE